MRHFFLKTREIAQLVDDWGHDCSSEKQAKEKATDSVNWTVADAGNLVRIARACEALANSLPLTATPKQKLEDCMTQFRDESWCKALDIAAKGLAPCPPRLRRWLKQQFKHHPAMNICGTASTETKAALLVALRRYSRTYEVGSPLWVPRLSALVAQYGNHGTRKDWAAWQKTRAKRE
jgi:hypothetical protein